MINCVKCNNPMTPCECKGVKFDLCKEYKSLVIRLLDYKTFVFKYYINI